MEPRSFKLEALLGVIVLLVLGLFAWLSFQVGSGAPRGAVTYDLLFDSALGLNEDNTVAIAGVKIGQVSGIDLDDDLRATVSLEVDAGVGLSIDSSAAIRTAGLLGDQFIAVELGAEDDVLVDGEAFQFTESALSIEKLVGQLVHDAGV